LSGAFALSKPDSTFFTAHTNVAKAMGSPHRPHTDLPTLGRASKQARQGKSLERRPHPTQRLG
jgi:hypothetical protein